jgi:hypothetical protein
MNQSRNLLLCAAALGILSGSTARAASVSISFDFPILAAAPGETVTFRGTVTNLEGVVVDLNGCAVTPTGQVTTDNCALFFANAPFTLNPGETSFAFDMFTVTVDVPYTDPYGLKPGVFTVIGGLEGPGGPSPDTNLGQADFFVEIVPEPGTASLLGLAGLLALTCARFRMGRAA